MDGGVGHIFAIPLNGLPLLLRTAVINIGDIAAGKCMDLNFGHAIRNEHAGQTPTSSEGPGLYGCDAGGDGYAGQTGAAHKGRIANHGNAVGNRDALQVGAVPE